MRKAKLIFISLSSVVCLAMLFAACGAESPEPTSVPQPAETLESETTVPAEDEVSEDESAEPEETPEVEAETSPGSPNSGLTAVIVSGDTASVGKPFTFDATQSRPGEADIVNYVWTLGDGTTMFGISVQHAYSEPGFYTVTLVITDANGQTDTEAKVVEILELEEPLTPTDEDQFVIVATVWELDNAMRGTVISLAFDEETLSGSAGCNEYAAFYMLNMIDEKSSAISISSIRTSGESCTAEVMAQERGYLDSLGSAGTIIVDDNKLIMETGAGTLIFSKVSD